MREIDFKLYLITDRGVVKKSLIDAVEDALKGGVKAVQLREKSMPTGELTTLALKIREITSKYSARLFINDRVDVAMCCSADGVHLGQNSMPVNAVRKITGEDFLIGQSTHSIDEAFKAEDSGADFITLGPVYETPSKMAYGDPIGVEIIEEVKDELEIPVFAIGGIKLENIKEAMENKADGIALISGILASDDIINRSKKFMELLK